MKDKFLTMGLENAPQIYLSGLRFSSCPNVKIILNEEVSIEALQFAVEMAQKRYFLLGCKIVEQDDLYKFARNDNAIIIKNMNYEEDKTLGKETNEYPWLITYFDNYFVFTFSHSLFDGVGSMEIIKTILYYYAKFQGVKLDNIANVKTLDDDIEKMMDEELELSLETYNDKSAVPFKEKQNLTPSDIPKEKIMTEDEKSSQYTVTIDVNTLIPTLKKYETTPFAILVPLIARSLKHLYNENSAIIQTVTVVNSRPFVGSKTLRNFISLATIDYICEKMDSMPLERVSTIFRSILDVKINRENIVSSLTSRYEGSSRLQQLPLAQREQVLKSNMSKMVTSALSFSYTGKITLPPQLEAMVKNIEVSVDSPLSPIMIEVIGYQNKLTLVFTNRLKDTSYLDKFLEYLDELSVSYTTEQQKFLPKCYYFHK